jgi:hypothetical protein
MKTAASGTLPDIAFRLLGTPLSSLLRDHHRTSEFYPGRGKPRQLPPLGDPDTGKKDDDEP